MPDAASSPEVDQLVARMLPALRAFVRLRMRPELRAREESCDLVQSVAREVLQHSDRFRHGGEDGFRAWLFTTAHRKIANRLEHARAARRAADREATDGPPDELPDAADSPSQQIVLREDFARLEAAFDLLSDEQREVVTLSRVLGLPHAAIADRLGKTELAVRKTLSRAMARLAAHLADGTTSRP